MAATDGIVGSPGWGVIAFWQSARAIFAHRPDVVLVDVVLVDGQARGIIARNLVTDRAREGGRLEFRESLDDPRGEDPTEIASARLELRRPRQAPAAVQRRSPLRAGHRVH